MLIGGAVKLLPVPPKVMTARAEGSSAPRPAQNASQSILTCFFECILVK
jgi:hypothetical protein